MAKTFSWNPFARRAKLKLLCKQRTATCRGVSLRTLGRNNRRIKELQGEIADIKEFKRRNSIGELNEADTILARAHLGEVSPPVARFDRQSELNQLLQENRTLKRQLKRMREK